jgi:ubiquinone/menaquinone biosynthesis C-methylase UbiE
MNEPTAGLIDAWSAYWRSGQVTSCCGGSGSEHLLTRTWHEFTDAFADGARLLDLATGNGTVAATCAARMRMRGARLQIDAVDAARIDPARHVADPDGHLSAIRFHGGVTLEALPFADASFDALVSQFGFEYADPERAAVEAVRVLAPGGRLRFCIHATDGAVSSDIERRLERLRSVLAADGAVTLLLELARAAEARNRSKLGELTPRLSAAMQSVQRLRERPPADDAALFYAGEFLQLWEKRNRFDPSDLRRSFEDGWNNARGVALRQQEMLRVACSEAQIAALADRFRAMGMNVDAPRELRDDVRGIRVAWLLDARKPQATA